MEKERTLICDVCEEAVATVECLDCCAKSASEAVALLFCDSCCADVHKTRIFKTHDIVSLQLKQMRNSLHGTLEKYQSLTSQLEGRCKEFPELKKDIDGRYEEMRMQIKLKANELTRQIRQRSTELMDQLKKTSLEKISKVDECQRIYENTAQLFTKIHAQVRTNENLSVEEIKAYKDQLQELEKQYILEDHFPVVDSFSLLNYEELEKNIEHIDMQLCPVSKAQMVAENLTKVKDAFKEISEEQEADITIVTRINKLGVFEVQVNDEAIQDAITRLSSHTRVKFINSPDWNTLAEQHVDPTPGLQCYAQATKDKRWYRAVVVDVPPQKDVSLCMVKFVDKTGSEVVHTSSILLEDEDKLLDLPLQTIECVLNDVELSGTLPHSAQWEFQDLVRNHQHFTCLFKNQVIGEDGNKKIWKVDLSTKNSDGSVISVNQKVNDKVEDSNKPKGAIRCRDIRLNEKPENFTVVTENIGVGSTVEPPSGENKESIEKNEESSNVADQPFESTQQYDKALPYKSPDSKPSVDGTSDIRKENIDQGLLKEQEQTPSDSAQPDDSMPNLVPIFDSPSKQSSVIQNGYESPSMQQLVDLSSGHNGTIRSVEASDNVISGDIGQGQSGNNKVDQNQYSTSGSSQTSGMLKQNTSQASVHPHEDSPLTSNEVRDFQKTVERTQTESNANVNTVLHSEVAIESQYPNLYFSILEDSVLNVNVVTDLAKDGTFYVKNCNVAETEQEFAMFAQEVHQLGETVGPPTANFSSSLAYKQLVLAPFRQLGWCRAEVRKFHGENKVHMFYVDFGGYDSVDLAEVRMLPQRFHQLPYQSFQCSIASTDMTYFSKEASYNFWQMTMSRKLVAYIVSNSIPGKYFVKLFSGSTNIYQTLYETCANKKNPRQQPNQPQQQITILQRSDARSPEPPSQVMYSCTEDQQITFPQNVKEPQAGLNADASSFVSNKTIQDQESQLSQDECSLVSGFDHVYDEDAWVENDDTTKSQVSPTSFITGPAPVHLTGPPPIQQTGSNQSYQQQTGPPPSFTVNDYYGKRGDSQRSYPEGLCAICYKSGHIARYCPDWKPKGGEHPRYEGSRYTSSSYGRRGHQGNSSWDQPGGENTTTRQSGRKSKRRNQKK